jgi:hypothetical protein
MELTEKEYRKLRLGLAIMKLMGKVTKINSIKEAGAEEKEAISFRALEANSGIRHASIVEIVNGKKNAAWSTIAALLDGLQINLSQFGSVYDKINDDEIRAYIKELAEKKKKRERKKK